MSDQASSDSHDGRVLSIVVPVYQNESSVRQTLERLLNAHGEAQTNLGLEVCFVDDGSTDSSWTVLSALADERPDVVTVVKLSRNFGQVNAILAGYEVARGDAVVTISADLQDPPELLAQMVAQWQQGSDVVIAHRVERADDVTSRIFSRLAYGVARRAHPAMPAGGFDFLLLSRRSVDLLRRFPSRHRFFQGDILWLGLPTTFIPYSRERRPFGRSTWSFRKKFKYFTDLLLDSSFAPIQLMSRIGFLIAFAGLVYAMVIVFARIANQTPWPGWAPIMVTLLVVGGMIMVMLGIIGEYLWRIYDDVKGRPLFVIEASRASDDGQGTL